MPSAETQLLRSVRAELRRQRERAEGALRALATARDVAHAAEQRADAAEARADAMERRFDLLLLLLDADVRDRMARQPGIFGQPPEVKP